MVGLAFTLYRPASDRRPVPLLLAPFENERRRIYDDVACIASSSSHYAHASLSCFFIRPPCTDLVAVAFVSSLGLRPHCLRELRCVCFLSRASLLSSSHGRQRLPLLTRPFSTSLPTKSPTSRLMARRSSSPYGIPPDKRTTTDSGLCRTRTRTSSLSASRSTRLTRSTTSRRRCDRRVLKQRYDDLADSLRASPSGSPRFFTSARTCPSSSSAARRIFVRTRARSRSLRRRPSGPSRRPRASRSPRRLARGGTSSARRGLGRASGTSSRQLRGRLLRCVVDELGMILHGSADDLTCHHPGPWWQDWWPEEEV